MAQSVRNVLSVLIAFPLGFLGRRLTPQQKADAEESANSLRYLVRRHPELLELLTGGHPGPQGK